MDRTHQQQKNAFRDNALKKFRGGFIRPHPEKGMFPERMTAGVCRTGWGWKRGKIQKEVMPTIVGDLLEFPCVACCYRSTPRPWAAGWKTRLRSAHASAKRTLPLLLSAATRCNDLHDRPLLQHCFWTPFESRICTIVDDFFGKWPFRRSPVRVDHLYRSDLPRTCREISLKTHLLVVRIENWTACIFAVGYLLNALSQHCIALPLAASITWTNSGSFATFQAKDRSAVPTC